MTEQTIVLRDARPDETDAVFRTTIAAYLQYANYMPAEIWQEYRDDILENVRDAGNGDHIVAELEGKIAGSVLLKNPAPPNNAPEMRLLAVAPDARGLGIGRKLTEECIRRARGQGYPSLTLHTHKLMAAAMQMYERMGFVRAPELDFGLPEGGVVVGYRLEL